MVVIRIAIIEGEQNSIFRELGLIDQVAIELLDRKNVVILFEKYQVIIELVGINGELLWIALQFDNAMVEQHGTIAI